MLRDSRKILYSVDMVSKGDEAMFDKAHERS
jgi:hypothetical protein